MIQRVIILLLSTTSLLNAQERDRWIKPTAFGESAGVRQIGLLSDSRVDLADDLTLFAHPVLIFLSPTAELQITWAEQDVSAWSTWHRVSYPTPLMNLLQMEGDLGMVTPEAQVGFMLAIANGVRWSSVLGEGMATISAGVDVGFGNPDTRTRIDLPILYPRLLAFYDGWSTEVSLVYEFPLGGSFGATLEVNTFFNSTQLCLELTPRITWHMGDHWSLHLDPVVTYGTYPYGNDWQLILLPDLTYRW